MDLLRRLAANTPSGLPVARMIVRAGLTRAFGPPPADITAAPWDGDPGLFGPGSASWRVLAEPAAIVGGVRALLLQLMHPLAMAGVAQHSRFREDPLARLRRTSAYVGATTFGSTGQAIAAARGVRAIHGRVRGTAPGVGPYSASDPHLLAWVSIAFTASLLATDRAYAPRPVDARTADAFVAEQAVAAALLDPRLDLDEVAAEPEALRAGALPLPLRDEGSVPTTVAELTARLDAYAPELGVGPQGREALRFLLWPDLVPPVRAGYLPLLVAALATLDGRERRLLGLTAPDVVVRPAQLPARAMLSALRLAAGRSPALDAATRRVTGIAGGLAA